MTAPNASAAGTFRIGGEIEVARLGFGAMRIVGRGVWGPPEDEAEVLRVLRRLPELGVSFIDTADSYGPDVSEELIREALHPYKGLLIATKAGFTRSGPDQWAVDCRPERLIAETKRSLQKLGVEQIGLWQLHRIDPRVPRPEQFGAVKQLLDEGLIRHAGLSEATARDIEQASAVFPVASVQNRYNFADRAHEKALELCEARGIAFIPWYPLGAGALARKEMKIGRAGISTPDPALASVAKAHGATPGQIALAWVLRRSPVMLPIPGTSKVAHLEENVAAAAITLTDEEFASLDAGR